MPSNSTKILSFGAGLVVLITTGSILYTSNLPKNNTNNDIATNSSSSLVSSIISTSSLANSQSPRSSSVGQSLFKDGTYKVAGNYNLDDELEEMNVTVTLKNDLIESVDIETKASGKSLQYQKLFKEAISGEVKGKKLADAKVNKLSGASLTSIGFNKAIDTIANQAKI